MHKIIAYILIGVCVAILLYFSPLILAINNGTGPDSGTMSVTEAIGGFLLLMTSATLALSPIWLIGVWLLWADRRLSQAQQKVSALDERVWPPPPNNT